MIRPALRVSCLKIRGSLVLSSPPTLNALSHHKLPGHFGSGNFFVPAGHLLTSNKEAVTNLAAQLLFRRPLVERGEHRAALFPCWLEACSCP